MAGLRGAAHGAAWLVGGACAGAMVEIVGRELPYPARAAIALAVLGAAGTMAWMRGLREAVTPMRDPEAALAAERAMPALRQRLVTLAALPEGTPTSVRERLAGETDAMLEKFDPRPAAARGREVWILPAALAAFGLALAIPAARPYVLRALAIPGVAMPHRTRVEVLGDDPAAIPIGADFTIEARAHGVSPRAGLATVGSSRREMILGDGGVYRATLKDVREGFAYTVQLNDDTSAPRTVRVVTYPVATEVAVTESPAAYTRLPERKRPLDDLTFLAGSRVTVRVRASKTLAGRGSHITLGVSEGRPTDVPLEANGADAVASFTPPGKTTSMMVTLVDTDGLATQNPAPRHVEIVPDAPPTLSVLLPRRTDDVVTAKAVIRVGFEAGDDIGLTSVTLRFVARRDGVGREGQVDLDVRAGERKLAGTYPWGLEKQAYAEGTEIEWWLEAADGNVVSGPGRTTSEHRHLRIASEAEVRRALLERLDKSVEELQGTRESQQELARQLGTLVGEKPR